MPAERDEQRIDPGVLEILGAVSEAIGLAEHVQKVFPLDRLKTQRRHARIEKQLGLFAERLEDARGAVRLLQGVVDGNASDLPQGAIAFTIYGRSCLSTGAVSSSCSVRFKE